MLYKPLDRSSLFAKANTKTNYVYKRSSIYLEIA